MAQLGACAEMRFLEVPLKRFQKGEYNYITNNCHDYVNIVKREYYKIIEGVMRKKYGKKWRPC